MSVERLSDGTSGNPAGRGRTLLRIALVIAVVALLLVFGRSAAAYLPLFADWVEGLGAVGPLVFVVGYAAAVVAFVPGSVLTLAGGAIFGLFGGVLYVFTAAVLGSTASFLIARHVARDAIAKRIEGDARFGAIDRAVGEEGRKIVFLLRLSPVFPFNLLNYALGLTRVRLADYLVASIGMLPGTLLYVYLGKLGGDVAAAVGGAGRARGWPEWALLGVGLGATAVVTILITRIASRALTQATATATTPAVAGDSHR